MFNTRYNKITVDEFGQIVESPAKDKFVFYFISNDMRDELARLVFFFDLSTFFFHFNFENRPDNQHGGDDSDYSQRIGGRISESDFWNLGNGPVEFEL